MSIFSQVPVKKVQKTKFNLSHSKKLSIKMGNIYPILLEEIMPGDSMKCSSEVFIRFAPLLTPVMQRFYANVHFFFIPNRLVWEEWEDFITGGSDGTLTPVYPFTEITDTSKNQFTKGKLADYLGIPPTDGITVTENLKLSALPFRCYQLVYNEYYRDQNLEAPVEIYKTSGGVSGAENLAMTTMRVRSWKKDYFTSALPWAQRGAEVTLPFSEIQYKQPSTVKDLAGATASDGAISSLLGNTNNPAGPVVIDNIESVGAPTINELRKAYRLQEWLENNARGGARYIEQILSHFGQKSSDARLQRPEYLGGGKTNVVVSEVLNTTGITSTGDGGVQGRMAGHGVAIGRTNSFKRKFEEHGHIIGLLSVLPSASYYQGIERKWSRFDKLDYPFPEFAHLGEQEILNKELYVDYTTAGGENTFGYTPRYAEFKYGKSTIHGDFRDNLNIWHYAQIYANQPALNADFVRYNNDNRIWNVTDQTIDNLYVQVNNKLTAIRPLPYFGVPRT